MGLLINEIFLTLLINLNGHNLQKIKRNFSVAAVYRKKKERDRFTVDIDHLA